jgi:hypothetical protein
VKVCDDSTFAFRDGNEFVTGAFDDGEGNGFLRHCGLMIRTFCFEIWLKLLGSAYTYCLLICAGGLCWLESLVKGFRDGQ